MAVGFLFASLVIALCVPPAAHSLTWRGLFSRSAQLLLLAACAALAAIWAVCRIWREELGPPSRSLRAYAWSAAIWLPLLLLLWHEHTVWMILAPLPVAGILTHFTRRQYLQDSEQNDDNEPYTARDLFTTATAIAQTALPIGVPAILMALLLQGLGMAVAAGNDALAESLLIVLTATVVWFFTTLPPSALTPRQQRRGACSRRAAVLPCFLMTCLALTPFLVLGMGSGRLNAVVMAGVASVKPPAIQAQHAYAGIVLLAPPLPRQKLVPAPPRKLASSTSFVPRRPLTIPFDGFYTYFEQYPLYKSTEIETLLGDPIKANVHSIDLSPLTMEAHQLLPNHLDASCCRAFTVSLTNADHRYGRIDVEAILENITRDGKKTTRSLGTVPIVSSEAQKISIYRAPIDETLRFPMAGKSMAFNAITLRIKLSEHRNLAGAKVKIKDFTLVP
jgi:hypothetical protein